MKWYRFFAGGQLIRLYLTINILSILLLTGNLRAQSTPSCLSPFRGSLNALSSNVMRELNDFDNQALQLKRRIQNQIGDGRESDSVRQSNYNFLETLNCENVRSRQEQAQTTANYPSGDVTQARLVLAAVNLYFMHCDLAGRVSIVRQVANEQVPQNLM